MQEERYSQPQPDLEHDSHERESERELEGAREQRLPEQIDIVVEPHKTESVRVLQPIAREAVVHPSPKG